MLTQPGVEDLFYSIFAEHSLILLLSQNAQPQKLSSKKHLLEPLFAEKSQRAQLRSNKFGKMMSFLRLSKMWFLLAGFNADVCSAGDSKHSFLETADYFLCCNSDTPAIHFTASSV